MNEALNTFVPYKGRTHFAGEPVKVYRNLNKPGVVYG